MDINTTNYFYHKTLKNADGTPMLFKRNGKTQMKYGEFKIPVKRGLREYVYITALNINDFEKEIR